MALEVLCKALPCCPEGAAAGADYQQLVSALAQAEASGLDNIVMRN